MVNYLCSIRIVNYLILTADFRFLKKDSIASIHGRMKEKARVAIFDKFRDSEEG